MLCVVLLRGISMMNCKLTKEEFKTIILENQKKRHKQHERDLNTYIHENQCKTRKIARKSKYASQNPN